MLDRAMHSPSSTLKIPSASLIPPTSLVPAKEVKEVKEVKEASQRSVLIDHQGRRLGEGSHASAIDQSKIDMQAVAQSQSVVEHNEAIGADVVDHKSQGAQAEVNQPMESDMNQRDPSPSKHIRNVSGNTEINVSMEGPDEPIDSFTQLVNADTTLKAEMMVKANNDSQSQKPSLDEGLQPTTSDPIGKSPSRRSNM